MNLFIKFHNLNLIKSHYIIFKIIKSINSADLIIMIIL